MGMLFYRSKVNLLTGWIHHSVYVFIVEYAIQGHWSHIFGLFAVMEVSATYAVFPDLFFLTLARSRPLFSRWEALCHVFVLTPSLPSASF